MRKRLPSDIADVGSNDDVVERPEGVVRGKRLAVENVEAGAGELARAESLYEGFLLDDRTAGDVYQDGARLHLRHVVGAQCVARALREDEEDPEDVR